MKIFYQDRPYTPIHPKPDDEQLDLTCDRLLLYHTPNGPIFKTIEQGEGIHAGYVIGVFIDEPHTIDECRWLGCGYHGR